MSVEYCHIVVDDTNHEKGGQKLWQYDGYQDHGANDLGQSIIEESYGISKCVI